MMATPLRIRRKNAFNLVREGQKLGSFDEFPMLQPGVDPQIHLSRNEVDQPFYLVCEKDTVLALISGRASVAFSMGPVRQFDLQPADYVYVPGGVPHRALIAEPGLLLRYKAREPGAEAVLWRCDSCGAELDRHVWNANTTAPQAAYLFACERYNADEGRRRCSKCGREHPQLDLKAFRWAAVVEALAQRDEE